MLLFFFFFFSMSNIEYGPLPSVKDLQRNISIVFVNSHRSITMPRPSMPGQINIGGAHVKPPKDLPANIKVFLSNEIFKV